jgi:glycosyltransferase involved in cell wall biosynthesis
MKYSIIVAVYNRLDEVQELLPSVENLKFDKSKFELIFVDDGSNDGFKEFIESYQTNLNIVTLYQQNQGPGSARNNGMRNAKGDYFIFVDSDCILQDMWLKQLDDAVISEKYDAFGGPDTCHESFSPLLKAINYSMTSFIGTGGTRGGSKKAVTKFFPRSFNMGISREVYTTVGEMGGLRHGQDMDYSAKIYENGFKVGLVQEAFVYHKRRTSLKRFYKQIFNWGVARINLARLHKNMLKPIHLLPAFILCFIVAFFVTLAITPNEFMILLLKLGLIAYATILGFVILESTIKNKSLKVGILSTITINIQIFAYGFGLITALTKFLFGKEIKGFTKNYYK